MTYAQVLKTAIKNKSACNDHGRSLITKVRDNLPNTQSSTSIHKNMYVNKVCVNIKSDLGT